MERWNGKVALVTGASAGIGAAICKALVGHGLNVIGCARNVDAIQKMAEEEKSAKSSGTLHPIKCDLTKESEILGMFDEIRKKFGHVDICVNNAGISRHCPLLSGNTEDWRNIFQVNVLALCICTREAVKLMTEKNVNEGVVVNISSIGGHKLPDTPEGAGFNFYCGTKFMVRALTEGLRQEVKKIKPHIRISSISPGIVSTDFFKNNLDPKTIDYMVEAMGSLKAKDIADALVYILAAPARADISDIIVQEIKSKEEPTSIYL